MPIGRFLRLLALLRLLPPRRRGAALAGTARLTLLFGLVVIVTGGCRSASSTETATPPTTASVDAATTATSTPSASATAAPAASVAPPAGAARADAPRAGAPRTGCEGLFDPPEGAVRLCNEHVLAEKAEIAWSSWAVRASRWDAFQPYQKRAHDCGAGFVTKPPILSVSNGDTRLSFHEAKDTDYPSCAKKPEASYPTVLVLSTKHDR